MKLTENHKVKMYENVDFTPNDNIVFDDIASHLSLFPTFAEIDIGPNKSIDELDINVRIKLDVANKDITPNQINYCKIDDKYYYVLEANILSEGTLELVLQLDTLNSFSKYINNSSYWSDRTIISRQHKDRFNSNHDIVIDTFDEGYGSLPMYKTSDTTLKQNDSNTKWYLVYESNGDDANEPINPKVYCSEAYPVSINASRAFAFTKNGINSGVYYWDTRFHADGLTHTMVINGKNYTDVKWLLADLDNKKIYYGTSNSYYDEGSTNPSNWQSWSNPQVVDYNENYVTYIGQIWTKSSTGSVTRALGWKCALQINDSFKFNYNATKGRFYISGTGMRNQVANGNFEAEWTVATIDDVDRTSSLINKIVECPYCPLQLNSDNVISGISIKFDSEETDVRSHYGPLFIPTKQQRAFASKVVDVQLTDSIKLPDTRTQSDVKDIKYETKLLNSNFSKVKFTYDSFTKELKRELFNSSSGKTSIYFYQSLNMSSKLMFNFNCDYQEMDDYDKYLTCSRNNESTIYTSNYLNYIRNGYNYDIKTKALNDTKNAISVGTSVASTGLSMISGMGSIGTFSAINQGAGIVNNLTSFIVNNAQQELALEQKKYDALNSTVGVSGTDDASLLNIYNGNKLHMFKYSIRDSLKNSIYEQFYLTGYACNDYGRPTLNTRQNFNYIKAKTTIDTLIPVTNNIKADIVSRIDNGILIIHKCQDSLLGLFKYENWETSI